MLIDFAFKNFLSFKDEVVFSMLAAKSVKENEQVNGLPSNVTYVQNNTQRLVNVAAIYGANGSGKSNLLKAMYFYRKMILDSYSNENLLNDFSRQQFLFNGSADEKTQMEANFIVNDVRYRYGFEILDKRVESEWLYKQDADSLKERYCFKREKHEYKINLSTFKLPKQVVEITRDNALFLTVASLFNIPVATKIKEWFENDFNIISGIGNQTINYTAELFLSDEIMRERMMKFIKVADFGIQDITVKESLVEKLSDIKDPLLRKMMGSNDSSLAPKNLKELEIQSFHNQYVNDDVAGKVAIPFGMESVGTIKTFAIIGPWLDTLLNGKTLIVDEFGASIHTKLAIELLRLFYSKLNNGAQLIITTQDTNLLRKDILRRDQIWFVEKSKYGISDLYSLVEYKINQATSVRNDASFEKDYLIGKYGAIPFLGNIERFVKEYEEKR